MCSFSSCYATMYEVKYGDRVKAFELELFYDS